MKGKHHIIIQTAKLKYEFDIRRNITVIQGDSATGKTTLIGLLRDYAEYGTRTGVMLQADVPCVAFPSGLVQWENEIKGHENTIIFFDEGHSFIRTEEFAAVIRETSNYYVIITREALPNLPYSILEIYGIRNSGKYNYPEQIYHEFYPVYGIHLGSHSYRKYLLIEDSKSGFQFFDKTLNETKCISAEGNSKVYRIADNLSKDGSVCIIADGAAFGAFIEELFILYKHGRDMSMFFPESFEWLILKADVVSIPDADEVLEHPEDYIDSRMYFSWEQFFTDFIRTGTNGTQAEYHKNKLAGYYLDGRNRERIMYSIPDEIQRGLR